MATTHTPSKDTLYMLDTKTASYVIKGQPTAVRQHLQAVPMASLCVSSITKAELLLGAERKPEARRLHEAVREFLLRVDVLPWGDDEAECYAKIRAACDRSGTPLGSMDMLIAAHAAAVGAVLVTSDRAFHNVKHYLTLADWTKPL